MENSSQVKYELIMD